MLGLYSTPGTHSVENSNDLSPMNLPLVTNSESLNAPAKTVSQTQFVPDSAAVQAAKRLVSVWPLLAMCISTINQVLQVTQSITALGDDRSYDENVQVQSEGVYSYFTCQRGDASAVIVYCPYATQPAFQGVISVWSVYFFLFVSYRLVATWRYSTDDLRFFIAVDKLNGHRANQVFVATGALLTLASLAIGLYYLSPQTEWNNALDTRSAIDLAVFVGINALALRKFSKQAVTSHSGRNDDPSSTSMAEFTEPVPIHSKGILASVAAVVQPITISYLLYLRRRDDDAVLRQHGEPSQLMAALDKLYS